jgi:hypothetical protein
MEILPELDLELMMMKNSEKYTPIPGYHDHVPVSVTEEDAIRYLMYWSEQITLPYYKLPKNYNDDDLEFYNCFSIANALHQELENAETKEETNQLKLLLDKFYTYRSHLIDEIAKLDNSALRIDKAATTNQEIPHITTLSLFEWGASQNKLSSTSKVAKKTVFKHREQEKIIIKTITELGLDPKSFPDYESGKSGMKSKIREALSGNPLFRGSTVFNKAWERLSIDKRIIYQSDNPTPK